MVAVGLYRFLHDAGRSCADDAGGIVEKIEKCNEQGAWGVLWSKEAWGHYWSWDPKETWAAITWIAYLVYIHYRQIPLHRERLALWMLIISFVLLQMCWWGINYLPSAQGSSVHTY